MENKIMVSISCITYNHEKYIAKAIEGFLMQKTNFKFEILIHDDASTDRTSYIIKEYEKNYPELIKPIYQTENQYSKGVKVGMYNTTRSIGKYIALCEGDDYWTDSLKLQKQVDYMEKNSDCSMCYHAADIEDVRDGKLIGIIRPYNKDMILQEEKLFFGGGHVCPTASIMYKKEILKILPNFYLSFPVGDHPLALLAFTNGKVCYIDDCMSVRRLWVPGSWNTKHHDEIDNIKKFEYREKMIIGLKEFNTYSNKKWNEEVNKKIINLYIQQLNFKKEKKIFKDEEFVKLYNELRLSNKINVILGIKTPIIYKLLVKLKLVIRDIYKNKFKSLSNN